MGLRAVRNVLRHQGASREAFTLLTGSGFTVGMLTDLLHREKIGLRGLEQTRDEAGGRLQLVVKLPPRYDPERLVEVLARLEGVREAVWER